MSESLSKRLQMASARYRREIISKLSKDGQRLCTLAAKTKNTKNRTGAQLAAYFWMVVANGVIVAIGDSGVTYSNYQGDGHPGLPGTWWGSSSGDDWWSDFYEGLNDFLHNVAPQAKYGKDKYDLFILNAAYYTSWLEDGSYAVGLSKIMGHPIDVKNWHIISQIRSECERVAKKYGKNSKVTEVGIHGEPMKPA